MQIPDWYESLDPDGREGIIELPLEQQQDLLCAYQAILTIKKCTVLGPHCLPSLLDLKLWWWS